MVTLGQVVARLQQLVDEHGADTPVVVADGDIYADPRSRRARLYTRTEVITDRARVLQSIEESGPGVPVIVIEPRA